jgi:hypothetical protein
MKDRHLNVNVEEASIRQASEKHSLFYTVIPRWHDNYEMLTDHERDPADDLITVENRRQCDSLVLVPIS